MSTDVKLKCNCGKVEGRALNVSADSGTRLVCMCKDCQKFAKHLGNEDQILDQYGGTDIYQFTPSQIKIEKGIEHLKCLKLTKKGIVRWYTDCCNTPVANTLPAPKVAFVGMPHNFMEHENGMVGREKDLGPIRARIYGNEAIGTPPEGSHDTKTFGLLFRIIRLVFMGRIKGEYKPSPFFNSETGQITVKPIIVEKSI